LGNQRDQIGHRTIDLTGLQGGLPILSVGEEEQFYIYSLLRKVALLQCMVKWCRIDRAHHADLQCGQGFGTGGFLCGDIHIGFGFCPVTPGECKDGRENTEQSNDPVAHMEPLE
jgi:hypothetical protein